MARAIIYARSRNEDTAMMWAEFIHKECVKREIEVVGIVVDRGKANAPARPKLVEVLDRLRSGEADVLACYDCGILYGDRSYNTPNGRYWIRQVKEAQIMFGFEMVFASAQGDYIGDEFGRNPNRYERQPTR